MRRTRAVLSVVMGAAVVAGSPGLAMAAPPAAQAGPTAQAVTGTAPTLAALSNRADLVSGGDVLLAVGLPAGADAGALVVDVDGRDVTDAFSADGGRLVGLVDGLEVGVNTVTARVGRGEGARLQVTNHPVEGPVFSGPHLQPWACTTTAHGLAEAVDEGCNAPSVTSYFYKSTAGGALRAYDPAAPATDVATTEVDGEQVPYVVRRERGTMNRGVYDVATLWDLDDDQGVWTGKLLYPFGASSGTQHNQGAPSALTSVLVDHALARGYMVATNTLNTRGHSQNPVVSAETVMMLKEHITEAYGEIRFTMGQGGSGGAIGQQMVANNYPGLLDGIQPSLSFPDGTTTGMEVVDCVLLNRYFATTTATALATTQRPAITGHLNTVPCQFWQAAFGGLLNPTSGCGAGVDGTPLVYNAQTNPDGVRCTAQDYEKNIWGLDATGKANTPVSNVGVQYGLRALQSGVITPDQFIDLNARIGGVDKDNNPTAQRMEADPFAVRTAYRTGQVNDFSRADQVAIIDLRTPENSGIHTDYHSDEVRARLIRANGHADNQVIWRIASGTANATAATLQSFETMDAWLTAVEADTRDVPKEQKVRENRPGAAVDACFTNGTKTTDASCQAAFPTYAFPRIAAGGPVTHDNVDCQLQPLDRAAYGASFTDAQWATLRGLFTRGVCDYGKPSKHYEPSLPWVGFSAGPGGEPLGAAPSATTVAALPAPEPEPQPQPGLRFPDVPVGSIWFDDVEFLVGRGITLGLADGTFGTPLPVSRSQMASFLYRANGSPAFTAPTAPSFVDVPVGHTHYAAVEWLKARGTTLGSPAAGGGTAFRPEEGVARGQMAAFLHRDAGSPAVTLPATPRFRDVPADYVFAREVEWLASRAIAEGFTDGTFRPVTQVTRGQMALFLRRAFDTPQSG